jgi:hypothetical protein
MADRNWITETMDVFFNGRLAVEPTRVSIGELVKRGTSVIRVGDKYYRITAEEVEVELKIKERKGTICQDEQ